MRNVCHPVIVTYLLRGDNGSLILFTKPVSPYTCEFLINIKKCLKISNKCDKYDINVDFRFLNFINKC